MSAREILHELPSGSVIAAPGTTLVARADHGGNWYLAAAVSFPYTVGDLLAMSQDWIVLRYGAGGDPDDETHTVGRLRSLLADLPGGMPVVLAADAEGNGFMSLDEMTDGYVPAEAAMPGRFDETWPRYKASDDLTDVDPSSVAPEGSTACVILWPV